MVKFSNWVYFLIGLIGGAAGLITWISLSFVSTWPRFVPEFLSVGVLLLSVLISILINVYMFPPLQVYWATGLAMLGICAGGILITLLIRFQDSYSFQKAFSVTSSRSSQKNSNLEERTFLSPDLGITFEYLSNSDDQERVIAISQDGTQVKLTVGRNQFLGAITVFEKNGDTSFLEHLSRLYPDCKFYSHEFTQESKSFDRYEFPKGYVVAIPSTRCESLPSDSWIGFVLDQKKPGKYLLLQVTDEGLIEQRLWHHSLRFFD